jgi:hypothetical protein
VRSLLLGILASLSFGLLLIYQVDVEKSWEVLGRIDFRLMLTPTPITFVLFALRPWRWQQMFPSLFLRQALP